MAELNFLQGAVQSAQGALEQGKTALQGVFAGAASGNSLQNKQRALKPEYTVTILCEDANPRIEVKAALPPDFDWSTDTEYDTPFKDILQEIVSGASPKLTGGLRASGLSLVTQAMTAKIWAGSSTGDITLPLVFQAETDEVKEVLQPLLKLLKLNTPDTAPGGGILRAPGPRFDLASIAAPVLDQVINASSGALSAVGTTGSFVAGTKVIGGQISQAAQTSLSSLTSAAVGLAKDLTTGLQKGVAAEVLIGKVQSTANAVDQAAGSVDSKIRAGVKNKITLRIGNYMLFDSVVITNIQQKHYVQPVGSSYGSSTGNMQRVELSVTFRPFFDMTHSDIENVFIGLKKG